MAHGAARSNQPADRGAEWPTWFVIAAAHGAWGLAAVHADMLGPWLASAALALPWQADFNACGDNWWPVPRPNDVITEPGSGMPASRSEISVAIARPPPALSPASVMSAGLNPADSRKR